MLNVYIVTYDISSPKRLNKVFKTLRNYGDHIQLSVFECQMNDKDLVILKDKLNRLIKKEEDQVLIIRLGPAEGKAEFAVESLGRNYEPRDRSVVVA
jgi:CRISPR-associated protein Cas2